MIRYIIFLFFSSLSVTGQTKFDYVLEYPAIYDSVNKLTYSFDSAAPTFLASERALGKKQ